MLYHITLSAPLHYYIMHPVQTNRSYTKFNVSRLHTVSPFPVLNSRMQIQFDSLGSYTLCITRLVSKAIAIIATFHFTTAVLLVVSGCRESVIYQECVMVQHCIERTSVYSIGLLGVELSPLKSQTHPLKL